MMVKRSAWGNFPAIIVHSTQPTLSGHAAYAEAKAGDFRAARLVAAECTRADVLTWRPDFIVPVLRLEAPGKWNPLPLALAERLALLTGAKVVTSVVQTNPPPAGSPDAIEQLLQQPVFDGAMPKGTCLIVDETVELGSALANLRGYIESRGGEVAAATTFTARMFASRLRPDPATFTSLKRRFGHELSLVPEKLGFPLEQLTHKESLFLNGLTTLDAIRDPLAPTHRVVQPALGTHA
jgi:hypothetical protein